MIRYSTVSSLSLFILLLISCGCEEGPANLPPPKIQVYVTTATDVPIYREFVGETLGDSNVDITARVKGFLEGRYFQEGSRVKKGKLLYTIESQPFEEKVAQAQSNLAAQSINLANAKSDLDRIRPLAEQNAISQIDLDAAQARYEASIEAVKAAQANLRAAELELSYTKIHSPIDGVIGKTNAQVGDFVGASPNPVILTTVSYINTMAVQFFLTQSEYLEAARRILDDELAEETEAKEEPDDLELILADNTVYGYKGRFDFIDRSFESSTGAILIQASFPNPDELLRPGLFAKVRAKVEEVKNGILVPQRCVIELQGIFNVLVVDEENKVQNRQVKVGPKIKGFWLITEGLKPGERVIYEGLQKVKEGQVVQPETVDIKIPDLNSI